MILLIHYEFNKLLTDARSHSSKSITNAYMVW